MRKLLKRTLALLLCLAMLGGFAVVPQVNAQSAETLPPIDLTQFGNQVVYGKAGETTFVPAGYTFVYEDENGEIYAQQAPADVYISLKALTPEQAEALAGLSGGQESYTVSDSGTVLARRDFDAAEAARYSAQVQSIMGGQPIREGAEVSFITDAYAAQSAVRVMVVFDDAPVSKLEGMTVTLGQSLGQAELNASRAIEEKQLTQVQAMEKALGYAVEVSGQFSLISNAVAVTVNYRDLARLNKMEGVKKAYVMPTFSVPETQTTVVDSLLEIAPNMKFAGPAMGANQAWDVGYKGEGMSVAILDTGLSFSNIAFSAEPADQSRVAYTREDIATILENNELNAEVLSADTSIDTVYYSSKIPFGFSYGDALANFGEDLSWAGHGTHVAGIVAGNIPEAIVDQIQMDTLGIAPEAQLIILNVFDQNQNCYLDYLIAAIEDCITLGVDCANLSLGSPSGPYYLEGMTEFYDAAYEAGINVVVSAGNDAHTGYNSLWGYDYVKSDSVSTGTIGMPGTFDSVLTVASAENAYMFNVYGNSMSFPHPIDPSVTFVLRYEELEVPEGMGFRERLELQNLQWSDDPTDAEGKLLFLPFEGGNADHLVDEAIAAGAVGLVLIYPATEENMWGQFIEMTITKYDIPVCKMDEVQYPYVEFMLPETLRVDAAWNPMETAGEMSVFSSWGPTESLTLKPEITGIGGNVFSAYMNNQFAVMSGTSMSSPAVAATATLLRQYLRENELVAEDELNHVVNCLLMSTATPLYDEEHGTYYAVRRQGAGMANIGLALESEAYITAEGTNKAKLELGDDPEKTGLYEMTFEVVNLSDRDKTYTLNTTVLGQKADGGQLKGGKVTYLTHDYVRELESTVTTSLRGDTLTVPADSTAEVTVTVELSEKEKAYYDERFPAGAYVEGFIQLLSEESVPLVVPFLGFYGNFEDGPILEPGAYDTILGGDRAYNIADQVHNALVGTVNYLDNLSFETRATKDHYLGDSFYTPGFKVPHDQYFGHPLYSQFFSEMAGISPNGDLNLDTFQLRLGLRRNAENIHYTVTNRETGEILWEQDTYFVPKSYKTDAYAGAELSKEWLHPSELINVGTPWEMVIYDTTQCLLENNTWVEIRADITPEGKTAPTESKTFTLYIDNLGPIQPQDLHIKEYYGSVYFATDWSEYWFNDYYEYYTLNYDEAADVWSGSVVTTFLGGSNIPDKGFTGEGGSTLWRFTENQKFLAFYYDYAGNCSAYEFRGGDYMAEYVDLTAEKTTINLGETLTITDVAENEFNTTLSWQVSDPTVASIVESDGHSVTIQALAQGTVTVTGGFISMGTVVGETLEIQVVDPEFEALREKFVDVPGHWAEEDILAAVYHGLFKGMDETHFAPDTATTRGQLVTILHRTAGEPESTKSATFRDVPENAYYAEAVAWAAENGIVTGRSETVFAPNEVITREQLVTMLYRYAQYAGLDTSARADLGGYIDADTVSDYACEAFSWAVATGLVNGTTETTLTPRGTATRAQSATVLIRFLAF